MCSAPKEKVKCPVNHINLVQCCTRSPTKGGQHQQASKYCEEHQHLDSPSSSSLSLKVQIPLHGLRLNTPTDNAPLFGSLPDADSTELLTGCRKVSNVNKFFDRTAGIVAAVRSCGIVVNFSEMYTCESPTQMYIFLSFTFCHGRDIDRLKYVAYDRACDLHPFLRNLQSKGVLLASLISMKSLWR